MPPIGLWTWYFVGAMDCSTLFGPVLPKGDPIDWVLLS